MSVLAFSLIGGMVQQLFGAPGVVAFVMLSVALACVPRAEKAGMQVSDEYAEIWLREIVKRLFKNNAFLSYANNEDEYVVGGRIVHIPQPGTRPTVTKNRSSFPATAVRRTDSDITYNLDEYTTAPSHLPYKEVAEITYDKLSSLITDHFGYLIQDMSDDILFKWADELPFESIVMTTGASTAANYSGMSGNRLAMTADDLKKARLLLNQQNVPQEGRILVIESNMMDQLAASLGVTQYRDFSREYDAKTGTIGQLYGFNVIERSSVVTAPNLSSGSLAANDFETAVGAADNIVALAYHPNMVSRAMGERKIFNDPNRPEYYGDLNSALIRMGGRRRRSDDAGVVAIMGATATGA